MKRRRFLQILGATVGTMGQARAGEDWSGQGLGADLSLTLLGKGNRAGVLSNLPRLIRQIEAEFSLYNPESSLSRLNREGRLTPSRMFLELIDHATVIHDLTAGSFDPTVQGLWEERTGNLSKPLIGWSCLQRTGAHLVLPPGCALTLNGIAQGYAADCVKRLLAENGYTEALIDLGEQYAMGGPWKIGVSDPSFGQLATFSLSNVAIATSSPFATLVSGRPHLIHPSGKPPLWSTLSVEASDAVYADGFSTAAIFFSAKELQDILSRTDQIRRITLVDFDGNLQTLRA